MRNERQSRIFAFMGDIIAIGSINTFAENIFSFFNESESFVFLGLHFTYNFSVSFLLYLCYFMLFDLINHGTTFGKLIFGIKIASKDESKLATTVCLKRSLLKIVSIIILPIAAALFLFKDRFTIHDHFANTITVYKS